MSQSSPPTTQPTRFESVLPYVWVRDLDDATRHYTETLGFEIAYDVEYEEGGKPVRVVGVERGGAKFELNICGCANHQHDGLAYFAVQADGVNALHDEYQAKGALVTCTLKGKDGEVFRFTVDDPDGNRVHFFEAS